MARATLTHPRTALAAVALLVVALVLVLVVVGLPSGGHRRRPPRPVFGAGGARWTPLGEPGAGGRATGLAIDPADPNRILVGGDISGIGLSTDGGRRWQASTGLEAWEVNAFTWDRAHPDRVWVGTMSGPYESTDAGRTWTARHAGMPTGDFPYSRPVQTVLIDSSDDRRLLAFGGSQRQLAAPGSGAAHYGLVYESTDGGASWRTIGDVGDNVNILDAVGSPDLSTLYVAALGHGVLKSTDGGRTWQSVDTGLSADRKVTGLAIDPGHPNTVWAAVSRTLTKAGGVYRPGGIIRTTDGGASWTAADDGLPRRSGPRGRATTSMFSVLRAGDGTLYTADQNAPTGARYRSSDGGLHWTRAGGHFDKFYPAAANPYAWASSANGGLVVGGSSDTLMASRNRGATWRAIDAAPAGGGWQGGGYSALLGTRVAFDADRPQTMLLSAFDAGNVLRSTDGGGSWTRPLAGSRYTYSGGYDVTLGGPGDQIAYAVLGQSGSFRGVAVSTDTGRRWSVHVGGSLPRRAKHDPGQGAVAIASTDGRTAYVVAPDRGLYETTDTGRQWRRIALSAPADAVAADPRNGTAYVATSAGVWRIRAGGRPVLIPASPGRLQRLVVAPSGAVYGTGPPADPERSGAWTDRGGPWRRISANPYADDIAIDPHDPNRIAVATSDQPYRTRSEATGVWISCNAGRTFRPDNAGLAMLRVTSVAFDPRHAGHMVIATNGRGFWERTAPRCR